MLCASLTYCGDFSSNVNGFCKQMYVKSQIHPQVLTVIGSEDRYPSRKCCVTFKESESQWAHGA